MRARALRVVLWRSSPRSPGANRAGLRVLALACACAATGCAGPMGSTSFDAMLDDVLEDVGIRQEPPSDQRTVVAGLKEALRIGTENAVRLTSAEDGFLGNERIRIPLPDSLEPMADALRSVGLRYQVDELEIAMNRAAERAAGEAGPIFWKAIGAMTIADAHGILEGGDTAATDYFRRKTSVPLFERFEPIVEEKMQEVGLVQLYDELTGYYRQIPMVGSARPLPEVEAYVTEHALDGVFTMLGEEERKIRTDPAARVTELLRTVFGG
ncbi:MAG: DUF4197 domain-containing protein [Deltaproteobacteria bacterium]|nr:MAG: DUF4197 domain-containing protein [Deltaproteobacteria bacterium]